MLYLADLRRVDCIPCRQAKIFTRTCPLSPLSCSFFFFYLFCLFQATAWLRGALSASRSPPANPQGGLSVGVDSSIAATALARHLIRRVPFEAKPVLLAVQEAAEHAAEHAAAAAAGGRGLGAGAPSTRRSGKRKHVSGSGEGSGSGSAPGLPVVASLLKAARAAVQSPLLPLPVPVPVSPAPPRSEGSESGGTSGARALSSSVDGGLKGSTTREGGWEAADASPASVTAEMLLSSFVRSPAAVRRSIREAMQQG